MSTHESRICIPAEVLFEVLSFFNRTQLEVLEVNSRHLYQFISKHFPTFPFNTIAELCISESVSHEPQFSKYLDFSGKFPYTASSLEELRYFSNSGKWIVKRVSLNSFGHKWLSAEWKCALESISSLWQHKMLEMLVTNCIAQFQELINWSTLQTFDHISLLSIRDNNIQLHQLSTTLLYRFSIIEFGLYRCQLSPFDLLTFLENIPKERQNKLIVRLRMSFCLFGQRKRLLRLAKQSFASAKSRRSYELQIVQESRPERDAIKVFRRVNKKTGEVLQCYMDHTNKNECKYSSVTVLKRSLL